MKEQYLCPIHGEVTDPFTAEVGSIRLVAGDLIDDTREVHYCKICGFELEVVPEAKENDSEEPPPF